MQTKLKKFIYDNGVMPKDIPAFTQKVDVDKFGLSEHHIYRIENGHTNPTTNTLVIICESLSLMLDRDITPNDLINFRTLAQIKEDISRNSK